MKKYHLIKFLKLKFSFIDIFDFFRGNFRYYFYYTKGWEWMIRNHIRKQITYRIFVMNNDCYKQGYCKECGCSTTNLQMANKACEGKCYPPMMNSKDWELYKEKLCGKKK